MLYTSPNLMTKFLDDRRHLSSIKSYVSYSEDERPYLSIAHPAILATFMGYLKYQSRIADEKKEVFFRGQTDNYKNIIPSLLRGNDFDKINTLSEAYENLKRQVQKLYKSTRFRNETIDNLLQHYGIKSKTLDLVDNIYVAIWFASNKWQQVEGFSNLCTYKESNQKFGWIYFMLVDPPSINQETSSPSFNGFCDLRKYHSSLSVRLHCQHGITYFRNNNGKWTEQNRCFDDLVIATVRIPNSEEFKMKGTIFTRDFLFPNSEIDNTYKLLRREKFAELVANVEMEFKLLPGSLGKIWTYNF